MHLLKEEYEMTNFDGVFRDEDMLHQELRNGTKPYGLLKGQTHGALAWLKPRPNEVVVMTVSLVSDVSI